MTTPTRTKTKTNTKEAYEMIINDYAFYGAYTYGGWQTLSAIAVALNTPAKLNRVYVQENKILLGE